MIYFTDKELACSCCGKASMDRQFMVEMDHLRKAAGFPFIVTSGYRCPIHNDEVSSTGLTGPHTTGRAIDIACSHRQAYTILKLALRHGFTGIGIKQSGSGRFIHLDNLNATDRRPRPHIWGYS